MLGTWRPHTDYQHFVRANLSKLAFINPNLLYKHEDLISKLYLLDPDPLNPSSVSTRRQTSCSPA